MQYKIPVQIENEDALFLGLSIRQIMIIMGFGMVGYSVFKNLEPSLGGTPALFVALIPLLFWLFIALFKQAEMTAVPFVLNMIRLSLTEPQRLWSSGIDSPHPFDVGYVSPQTQITVKRSEEKASVSDRMDEVENRLSKL